jgi:NADH-ubiquinone reductase complex 1 MLRQ subunit
VALRAWSESEVRSLCLAFVPSQSTGQPVIEKDTSELYAGRYGYTLAIRGFSRWMAIFSNTVLLAISLAAVAAVVVLSYLLYASLMRTTCSLSPSVSRTCPSLDSVVLQTQGRLQSTQSTQAIYANLRNSRTTKSNWLSDPSTYPLLVALGGAVAMAAGVGLSCLTYNPDVRISKDKKHALIRDWTMH